MKIISYVLLVLPLLAGTAYSQAVSSAPAAGHAPDAVEEMANALMRSGAISQPDWWKVMSMRSAELKAAGAEPVKSSSTAVQVAVVPAVPVAPAVQPVAAQAPATLIPGMKLGGLAWFRYTYADSAPKVMNSTAFGLKVARLSFAGDLPSSFKYSIVLDFARIPSTSTENSALYDWTLIYAPRPEFNLTMGQFTVPASAELLTPTSQIDFAARYYAQERILNASSNHDQGVQAGGKVFNQRLQYYAGVFNGKGANYAENDNDKFLYSGRLAWTAFKGKLAGRDTVFTAGASGMEESTRGDSSSLKVSDSTGRVFTRAYVRRVYGGDLAFKTGPATLKGEYITAHLDGRGNDPEMQAYGWYTTAALRLPGDKVELLARVQGYDPDTAHRNSKDIKWTTFGLNWFINGNTTRALLNYTVKEEKKGHVPNNELLAQMQLAF